MHSRIASGKSSIKHFSKGEQKNSLPLGECTMHFLYLIDANQNGNLSRNHSTLAKALRSPGNRFTDVCFAPANGFGRLSFRQIAINPTAIKYNSLSQALL